jgi:hypothetical protein
MAGVINLRQCPRKQSRAIAQINQVGVDASVRGSDGTSQKLFFKQQSSCSRLILCVELGELMQISSFQSAHPKVGS